MSKSVSPNNIRGASVETTNSNIVEGLANNEADAKNKFKSSTQIPRNEVSQGNFYNNISADREDPFTTKNELNRTLGPRHVSDRKGELHTTSTPILMNKKFALASQY